VKRVVQSLEIRMIDSAHVSSSRPHRIQEITFKTVQKLDR
jgi:hypothetical protein